MKRHVLDFEQPIADLTAKLEELRRVGVAADASMADEINRLEAKIKTLHESTYANLTDWQVSQLARHPQRPYLMDYIPLIFTEFDELHGDRLFGDDESIVGGTARLDGQPVMVIGHQKGRDTKEKIRRNFGMPNPEGYRKAMRLMQMAERFHMPVLNFIDTAGAYPGIGGEERGQAEAIARNLVVMAQLKTPIICTILGEGCSGGALAIGVGDRLLMLQYSTYSVITPEGCASILWKSAEKAPLAAEAMKMTASRLYDLKVADEVVPEPAGGAHQDVPLVAKRLHDALIDNLRPLQQLSTEQLLEQRYDRLRHYGLSHLE